MSKTCPGITGDILHARNLLPDDADRLYRLVNVWHSNLAKNQLRRSFYEMQAKVENIGIAIKRETLAKLDASCGWPKKAVNVPAERSVIDSFTSESPDVRSTLARIARDNRLVSKYGMATKTELYHGLCMWTLSRNDTGRSKVSIKAHSAESAAVAWDCYNERVECGMAIVSTRPIGPRNSNSIPNIVNLYTDEATVVLRLSEENNHDWTAEYAPNPMGRPLIEAMSFEPTLMKPFGQSRINRAVMSITMNKLREDMRSEVTAEFASSVFKYLLGAGDDAFEGNKYESYIGSLFVTSKDEDGDVPVFGQLPQLSMQPHVDYTRMLAAQIAGETSLPISTFGIIHDNPSSAEAMRSAERDMVGIVQRMNEHNGDALRSVLMMAQAIDGGVGRSLDALSDDERDIDVVFHDPSMSNLAETADAWVKLVTVAPWIAGTEEFITSQGIDRTTAVSMLNQKRRMDGSSFMFGGYLGNDQPQGDGPLPQQAGTGAGAGAISDVAGVDGTDQPQRSNGGVIA